jgi:hypothetical protein
VASIIGIARHDWRYKIRLGVCHGKLGLAI